MYIKTVYKKEPVFQNSKVVYSVYNNAFEGSLAKSFNTKALIHKDIKDADFEYFKKGDFAGLNKGGITHSDAVIIGDQNLDKTLKTFMKTQKNKPVLDYVNGEEFPGVYQEFYQSLTKK